MISNAIETGSPQNSLRLGGSGKLVEIGEAKFGKHVNSTWVVTERECGCLVEWTERLDNAAWYLALETPAWC